MKYLLRLTGLALVCALPAPPVLAQNAISVVINGSPVAFDQPPIQQAGRIFVPLRGVFEALGASVVYENGRINATSGNRTIGLTVGSTDAVVSGTPKTLDAAPFTIAGRTLVPLRFIAEALGASVDYRDSAQTVYITQAKAAPHAPPPPPPASISLLRVQPAANGASDLRRPEISASFSVPVNPDSIAVKLDGRNMASQAYVSDRAFSYVPDFDLPAGRHNVEVAGRLRDGRPFRNGWAFTAIKPVPQNFINSLQPPEGRRVGGNFTVSGKTRPGSRITIIAVANARVYGFEVNQNTARVLATTDRSGFFRANVSVLDAGSGIIDVRIESVAQDGGRAVSTLRLRT